MTTKQLSLHCKSIGMMCLAGGALTMASCAQDDLTGEQFGSGVRNSQLVAPSADQISVTPSTDGSQQIIAWPVVEGAGGYHAVLTNVDNGEVVKDTLIDGITFAAQRIEDTNYTLALSVLDNEKLNNKGSEAVTKAFSTFTATYQVIPDGTDLATYFEEYAVPDEGLTTMLCYDLQPGGEYTMSKSVDFGNKQVTLRTTSISNHAKLKFTADNVSIKTGTIFALKNLDIDASQSFDPLISLSTPDESIKGTGDYYIVRGALTINGCNITGVNNNLIYDGNKKYCYESVVINNTMAHLTLSSQTNVSGNAVIYFKGGFANTLQVSNSTIWNTGDSDSKYFVQYNNSGRATRAGYNNSNVNFLNCTFYNIAKTGQWANYGGFNGQKCSYFDVERNIFVDCGNKQVIRRILGGRSASSYDVVKTQFNTYMFDGEFESTGGIVENYDVTGNCLETDPGFKDAKNGDFTISGSAQLENKTGDPRWIKTAE